MDAGALGLRSSSAAFLAALLGTGSKSAAGNTLTLRMVASQAAV